LNILTLLRGALSKIATSIKGMLPSPAIFTETMETPEILRTLVFYIIDIQRSQNDTKESKLILPTISLINTIDVLRAIYNCDPTDPIIARILRIIEKDGSNEEVRELAKQRLFETPDNSLILQ